MKILLNLLKYFCRETPETTDDAGDSNDVDVDESMLDSSGVSDASSNAEPEDLGTADAYEAEVMQLLWSQMM